MSLAAVTVTTSASIVLAADGNRRSCAIKSLSTNSVAVYLKFDGDPTALTAANGLPLSPGESISLTYGTIASDRSYPVYAITASGTAEVRVVGL